MMQGSSSPAEGDGANPRDEMTRLTWLLMILCGLPLLTGCPAAGDDDDSATDDDDAADDDDATADDDDATADDDDAVDDDDSASADFTFTHVANEIVFPNCSCHASGSGGWAHNNSAADLYAAWVGTESGGAAPMPRIDDAGDPENSYVVHKLQGTHADPAVGGSGGQMPASGPPYLDQADIDYVRGWVSAGAPNN